MFEVDFQKNLSVAATGKILVCNAASHNEEIVHPASIQIHKKQQ